MNTPTASTPKASPDGIKRAVCQSCGSTHVTVETDGLRNVALGEEIFRLRAANADLLKALNLYMELPLRGQPTPQERRAMEAAGAAMAKARP
jgi:hypothetical protein